MAEQFQARGGKSEIPWTDIQRKNQQGMLCLAGVPIAASQASPLSLALRSIFHSAIRMAHRDPNGIRHGMIGAGKHVTGVGQAPIAVATYVLRRTIRDNVAVTGFTYCIWLKDVAGETCPQNAHNLSFGHDETQQQIRARYMTLQDCNTYHDRKMCGVPLQMTSVKENLLCLVILGRSARNRT